MTHPLYEAERTGLAHQDAALTKREGTIARISSTSCARSTLLSESRHRLAIICYKSIKNPRDGKVTNPQKMMGKNQITFMRTHATFCGFRQKQIKTFCGFRQNKVKTFCGFRHIRTKTFYGFRQNKVKTPAHDKDKSRTKTAFLLIIKPLYKNPY